MTIKILSLNIFEIFKVFFIVVKFFSHQKKSLFSNVNNIIIHIPFTYSICQASSKHFTFSHLLGLSK